MQPEIERKSCPACRAVCVASMPVCPICRYVFPLYSTPPAHAHPNRVLLGIAAAVVVLALLAVVLSAARIAGRREYQRHAAELALCVSPGDALRLQIGMTPDQVIATIGDHYTIGPNPNSHRSAMFYDTSEDGLIGLGFYENRLDMIRCSEHSGKEIYSVNGPHVDDD